MSGEKKTPEHPPLLNTDVAANLERVKKSGILQYRSDALPIWCPGCGYYGITHGLTQALNELRIENRNLVAVSGIGCAGRFPFFVNGYGFHAIHGRVLPVACGVKIANPQLTVIGIAGDGDALAIGGGHLPHAIRRNVDITYILFDNAIYGLTKGQSSPTTPQGQITGTHPYGNPDYPLNPLLLALAYGASFVACGYAGEPHALNEILLHALTHEGFSFVAVVSPCVTFDHVNVTYERLREKWHPVPKEHDSSDRKAAITLAMDEDFRYGIFYEDHRSTWADTERDTVAKATHAEPED
jgi:2-oxoglutarate ferredoxin oxidoreductase subunit beta